MHLFRKSLSGQCHLFVKTLILQNNATNRQNGCKIIVKNLENPYNTRILTIFKVASFLSTPIK